ncbi:phenylacetyl-CoA ligase [Mycena sp. CBHHK59/15]|nr:phenylacetyl-CoA ligase [Mycena sp. CBHHK59/15]
MAEYNSPMHTVPYFPDDLTIPQFLFDYQHPIRLPRDPEAPWIVDAVSGEKISRGGGRFLFLLRERTWCLANGLSIHYSLGRHTREQILCPNHVDFPIAIWAAHRLGASVFTLNPTFSADELVPHLLDMKPTLLFVHSEALEAVRKSANQIGFCHDHIVLLASSNTKEKCPENPSPEVSELATLQDLVNLGLSNKETHQFCEFKLKPGEGKTKVALYFPSSGTTGVPKMAAIPHTSVIANIIQNAAHDAGVNMSIPVMERRFRPEDVSCAGKSSACIYSPGRNLLHYHLFSGMVVVVMPKFDFSELLSVIKRYQINHLSLVPPIMVLFCKARTPHPAVKAEDLTSLRVVFVGGAPVNIHFVQTMAKLVPQAVIEQSYGMTEVAGILAMPPLNRRLATSSGGHLLPGFTARVMKRDGSIAGPGETGELYVTGPSLAIHYLNNEKISKETFVDGWIHTGDEVYFDENGEIHVVDRIKEFIKVRAFQVAPAELEARLVANPDVVDCCVVPVPHEFSGEIPKAYVVLSKEALERIHQNPEESENIKTALIEDIANNRAKYKQLAGGVEFIDAIPRNAAGKLLRRVLRAKALADALRGPVPVANGAGFQSKHNTM